MEFLHPAMWHVALESWQWFHQVAAPCNVTRSSGIMTLNSPGGITLQYGRWLWDDMPLNSPKRLPDWNSTPGFDLDHITAVNMSFCNSLRHFIQIGPLSAEKMTSCPFSRWWIWILGSNNGFFEKPNYNLLNCLVFQKNVFLHFGVKIQNGGSPPSWILGVK